MVDKVDFQNKSVRKAIAAAEFGDERVSDQVFELAELLLRDGKFDFFAGEPVRSGRGFKAEDIVCFSLLFRFLADPYGGIYGDITLTHQLFADQGE